MSGARSSSSWVAYEPVHKVHRAGGEDLHVRRSPRRPRDTTWSSSSITAFARKVVRVRRVACRMTRVVALSRSLAGETTRKPRHARRRERRAARANVKCDRPTVYGAFAVRLVGEFCRSIWDFRRVNHSRTRRNWGSGSATLVGWIISGKAFLRIAYCSILCECTFLNEESALSRSVLLDFGLGDPTYAHLLHHQKASTYQKRE
jgi:hypothetical protein